MTQTAPAGTLEALTAALAANTAATLAQNVFLERIIAGQQAALDKVEAPKQSRGSSKATPAAEPAAAAAPAQPEPTPAAEPAAAAAPAVAEVSDDDVRNAALAYMDHLDPEGAADANKRDTAKRQVAATQINEILTWMGFAAGSKICGPESKLSAEQRKQAVFFIKRLQAGLTVDFNTDYDFDGEPTQGAAAPAADPLG